MSFPAGWDKRQLSRAGPPFGGGLPYGGPAFAFARWSHSTLCRSTGFFGALFQGCTISPLEGGCRHNRQNRIAATWCC